MVAGRLFFKAGRYIYRLLGLSANQQQKKLYSSPVLSQQESNRAIFDMIKAGKPKMISRFGTPESRCLLNYLEIVASRKTGALAKMDAAFKGSSAYWKDDVRNDLRDLVGFFPATDEMLERFSAFYIEQVKKIDAVGIWGFVPGETFLIQKYCPHALVYDPAALEPYFFDEPWSMALEGKKVLVIHPFSESIRQQYAKRTLIFENDKVLPAFELITIKAVQSIAGNKTAFKNWFEALESMQAQIDAIDFDVAIIGAGSYGLPLSAYVKEKGKISVHIGGATQILFGIMGNRWLDHPVISKLYNDHWTRPMAEETVKDASKVEGACYW